MKHLLLAIGLLLAAMFLAVAIKNSQLEVEVGRLRTLSEGLQRTRSGAVNNAFVCYTGSSKSQIEGLLK